MRIRSSGQSLEVLSPAKLNLFLEVLARRDDGYHEIETLMVPIRLFDTLRFSSVAEGVLQLECEQVSDARLQAAQEADVLPEGSGNLVVQAVETLRSGPEEHSGARMRLVKRIPLRAGLAGGSSNAAAALVAANAGWRLGKSTADLRERACRLGSDTSFFLAGGAAICRGRGEKVEPLAALTPLHCVVAHPPEGLSTADVYRACRPASQPVSPLPLVAALRAGNAARAARLLFNRLQPAAESLSPWIRRLRREFSSLDVLGHQMSGSGTSYFGICRHARHARRVASALRGRGLCQVFAASTC